MVVACASTSLVGTALPLFLIHPSEGNGAVYDGGRIDLVVFALVPGVLATLLASLAGWVVSGSYLAHQEEAG